MPVKDKGIGWNRKRVFIAPRVMSGVLDDLTSGVPASLGAGAPVFAEISAAFEIMGMQIAAAGDEVYHFWPIPWDMEMEQPLRFRVWFVHTSTDGDAPIWKLDYKGVGKQAALSDARSSADENLTFSAHTCSTTANSLEITAWKESTSDARNILTTDFAVLLALECDNLGSASANEIILLGLEVEYTIAAAPNSDPLKTRDAPSTGTGPNS